MGSAKGSTISGLSIPTSWGSINATFGISPEADGAIHLKQTYLIKHICEALGVFDD
jgi:hypothetical protein